MPVPFDDEAEAPLDPALERVQARLRRLMIIAAATLGVGFIAVVAAVVFRVSNIDRSGDGETWRSTIEIPAGARVVSTALDGDRMAVTLEAPDGQRVLVFHLPSGRRVGDTTILAR